MSRGRIVSVSLFLALLVIAQVRDIFAFEEHYPFSHYPMFSWMHISNTVHQYKAVGYPEDGAPAFHLDDPRQMRPFMPQRLSLTVQAFQNRDDFSTITTALARDVLRRYESGRRRGDHGGPPLSRLEIHRVTWEVRRDLSNKHTPQESVPLAAASMGEIAK